MAQSRETILVYMWDPISTDVYTLYAIQLRESVSVNVS